VDDALMSAKRARPLRLGARLHRCAPNVVHSLIALPPDNAIRTPGNVGGGQFAISRRVPLLRHRGMRLAQSIGRGNLSSRTARTSGRLRGAVDDERLPDMVLSVRTPPPRLEFGARHDLIGSDFPILRRMPLCGNERIGIAKAIRNRDLLARAARAA